MREGWEINKLVDVCKIGDGNHSSNYPKSNEMVGEGIPFIRANNMVNGKVAWSDMKFITKEKHAILKKGHLKEGDILFTNRGEIGKIAIVSSDFENANLNSQIAWFRCLDKLNNRFLFYFLLSPSMQSHYLLEKNGAALQQFTIRQINDIEIPLPPLPEQQRIVAILDEAFAAIAKAKANTEQNLLNAKELFESYLQSVFENKGEGWEEKTLIEVCEMKPQKKEARDKLKETGLVTFLPMEDLGVLNKEIVAVKERKLKDVAGSYTYFADNDVLLAKITPCFENGKIGIARNLINGIGFGSSEYIVFRSQGTVETEYLYYFLSRNIIRTEGKKLMKGSVGHKRVSKDWIENYVIPFPKSLVQQQTIVRNLDALSTETKKLTTIYQQKINDLEELKKSVLRKAFNGELKTEKSVFASN